MKKSFMSLGALVLSGVVLASCSFGEKGLDISKPKKGAAVDKISITANNRLIEINKDDNFADVYDQLNVGYLEMTPIDYIKDKKEYSYAEYRIEKESKSLKNTYFDGFKKPVEKTEKKTEINNNEVYYSGTRKSSHGSDSFEYEEYKDGYYQNIYETNVNNKYTFVEKDTNRYLYAGSYNYDDEGNRSIDFGTHSSEKYEKKDKNLKGKSDYKFDNVKYEYVNASEKPTDENYDKYYYGIDSNGDGRYYRISDFFEYVYNYDFYTYYMYEDYQDLYQGTFELTDKYIILNISSKYNEYLMELYYIIYYHDNPGASEEEFFTAYKEAFNNELKGSDYTIELWIDYTLDSPHNEGEKYLTISYLKINSTIKYNLSFVWDEDYLDYYDLNSETAKSILLGVTATAKEDSSYVCEAGMANKDYSKKIKSAKDKIKKNNDFDDINMKVGVIS